MTVLRDFDPEVANQLTSLVNLLASDPSVRRVVLFGSSATGQRSKNSDIDLLILVEDSDINIFEFSSSIRIKSFDLISFPLDLIVETVEEFQERSTLPTMERRIAREGQVLYAA